MLIEMTIKGLMVDPVTNMPIVILKDRGGERVLPIWVGIFEANAIDMEEAPTDAAELRGPELLRPVDQVLLGAGDRLDVDDVWQRALAAFERELIQERIRSGMAAAKARGQKLGRQPGQRRALAASRISSPARTSTGGWAVSTPGRCPMCSP